MACKMVAEKLVVRFSWVRVPALHCEYRPWTLKCKVPLALQLQLVSELLALPLHSTISFPLHIMGLIQI